VLALLICKSSHVGVDVDGIACPLHHLMPCSCKTWGHGFLPGAVLSHHAIVGGGALLGDAKPPGSDICRGANHRCTSDIEFYIELVAFARTCSP
jgi:hypothetical protein